MHQFACFWLSTIKPLLIKAKMEYIIFWLSVIFLFYTYLGYGAILSLWSKTRRLKLRKNYLYPEPHVTVIIAARNEEKNIERRLSNLTEQEYPLKKLHIIVVSDGSCDSTVEIIKKFINSIKDSKDSYPDINLIEMKENMGKAIAINVAAHEAKGEYIIFTDSRQRFKRDAIKELLANFYDESVGCVTGELLFVEGNNTEIINEMGVYWNFEKKIRKMESKIHSVAGATGAIYAIRKKLFYELPEGTILDDVYLPMKIVLSGYRTIFEEKAIAYDEVSKDFATEKRRKVRTLLGNYQLIRLMPTLLNPLKNPICFQYVSHKVLRLFLPFFYFAFLVSSYFIQGSWYKMCFYLAVCFPLLTVLELIPPVKRTSGLIARGISVSKTIVFLNYFAGIAFFYAIFKPSKKIW